MLVDLRSEVSNTFDWRDSAVTNRDIAAAILIEMVLRHVDDHIRQKRSDKTSGTVIKLQRLSGREKVGGEFLVVLHCVTSLGPCRDNKFGSVGKVQGEQVHS